MRFSPSRFAPVLLVLLCAAALPLLGCGDDPPESVVEGTSEPASGAAPGEAAGGGIAPVRAGEPTAAPPRSAGAPPTAGANANSSGGGPLRWDWPDGWTPEPPANSMRLAQAAIPGDAGPGTLTVFHFGPGQGGGTEANIERWIGQVEVAGEPERERFTVGDGYAVSWVDVAGTLKPSMMGTGPAEAQPDSRLLGAVVEAPGGSWFFKATGPDATLAAARADFRALLESLEPAG